MPVASPGVVCKEEGWDPKVVYRLSKTEQDNSQEPLPSAQDR